LKSFYEVLINYEYFLTASTKGAREATTLFLHANGECLTISVRTQSFSFSERTWDNGCVETVAKSK